MRWHCPPDTGFEIRALAVWGRARYLSVTEAPHNTDFHTWMGKKHVCFFQTAETGNRTPSSGVKGSGANHYPRAPYDGVPPQINIGFKFIFWDKGPLDTQSAGQRFSLSRGWKINYLFHLKQEAERAIPTWNGMTNTRDHHWSHELTNDHS